MAKRGAYRTRQKGLVEGCLVASPDRYLSIDDVLASLHDARESVGRTTVYRNLESLASSGAALKALAPDGQARYRLAPRDGAGQLVCLSCGRVLPLDCTMLGEFEQHVARAHGFSIDVARTVLYGTCSECAHAGTRA